MNKLPENATIYQPSPLVPSIGVIQIIHGMAEHQKRYKELADYLTDNGLIVITSDLIGHGDNVSCKEELGYFGDNAIKRLVSNAHDITLYAKSAFPDLPYFLLGHSMGTLISTCYFKKHDNELDGLFLSGMPGQNSAVGIAKLLIKILTAFKGEYHRSKFINNMANGPFSKRFPNEGSDFAWLANDKSVVRKYEQDPKCGYIFTLNGFYTLMELMDITYNSYDNWALKNKNCPIKLMSGSDDPCMVDKKTFLKSVSLFKNAGYNNTSYVLYNSQRHEIFNDTEKATAMETLLNDIKEIIKKQPDKRTE